MNVSPLPPHPPARAAHWQARSAPARHVALALASLALLICGAVPAWAAPVTGAYGSYGGYWASSSNSPSITRPNDSNLLLGFTVGGTTYSTGVDDGNLSSHGVSFTAAQFVAFVPDSVGVRAGSYIGVGRNWGGQVQAVTGVVPGSTTPLVSYLTDGTSGLELSSAIFNQVATTMSMPVQLTNLAALTDTVPDILATQVGMPSGPDSFRFVDAGGNLVGNVVMVNFAAVAVVGQQDWSFYEAVDPRAYNASVSVGAGTRDLRLLAYHLSDFGITSANIGSVAAFQQVLSGASDMSFVAYNRAAVAALQTDVAVALATNQATVSPGATVTFTVTVTNTGQAAAGLQLSAAPPPGFSLVAGSAAASAGTYDPASQSWSLGALANGATATLSFQAIAGAQGGTATAELTAILGTDTNATNNRATAPVAVMAPAAGGGLTPVPALQESGLLALVSAMLLLGLRRLRRQL